MRWLLRPRRRGWPPRLASLWRAHRHCCLSSACPTLCGSCHCRCGCRRHCHSHGLACQRAGCSRLHAHLCGGVLRHCFQLLSQRLLQRRRCCCLLLRRLRRLACPLGPEPSSPVPRCIARLSDTSRGLNHGQIGAAAVLQHDCCTVTLVADMIAMVSAVSPDRCPCRMWEQRPRPSGSDGVRCPLL